VTQLSEWLQIMLAEIARKQEEALRDAEEEARRRAAKPPVTAPPQKSQRVAAG
jgi:hypothetical protein